MRLQRILAAATTEWLDAGQDEGFLLHGSRLEQFAHWEEETDIALTPRRTPFPGSQRRRQRGTAGRGRSAAAARIRNGAAIGGNGTLTRRRANPIGPELAENAPWPWRA